MRLIDENSRSNTSACVSNLSLLSWMHVAMFRRVIITLVIGVLLFGVTGGITYNPAP